MNKETRKAILWIGGIIIFFIIAYGFAYLIAPGSYVYSENYKLNAPEKDVIAAVKKFKAMHPDMIDSNFVSSEGRRDSSYWYDFYFYLPRSKEVLFTWTRPNDNGTTDFNLVSVIAGSNMRNWKVVNKDLSPDDNRRIKYQFEAILMHLNIKYEDHGNSMSLW